MSRIHHSLLVALLLSAPLVSAQEAEPATPNSATESAAEPRADESTNEANRTDAPDGENLKQSRRFEPSEQISDDLSVAYPVDI